MNPSHFPTVTDCATAPCTVQTSTFYPPIRMRGTQDASLQPLCIGICFSGAVPRNLIHGVIVMPLPAPFKLIVIANNCYLLANPYLCFHRRGV
jgi:hypothetical protein